MLIAEAEIVDRFPMKSLIVFVKIRTRIRKYLTDIGYGTADLRVCPGNPKPRRTRRIVR